ncbi:hypothetical protein JTE90_019508 [Oedothorax gibbosus]|uniref:Uncharacterized protein n=1 Tax=Oedothorax gibbosus TaxID=931172 RepID=A0AAV6VI16_9ARAC|nr:hypothetical protein JTE90_019508 [Oedothorax gibbosus]
MAFFLKSGVWKGLDLIRFINTNYNPFIKFKRQPLVVPLQSTQDKIEKESSEIWICLLSLLLLLFVLHVITVYLSYKWRHKKTKVEIFRPNTSYLQFSPVLPNPSLAGKPDVLVRKLQRIKSLISTTLLDSNTNSELREDDLLDELNLKELAELFMEVLELIEHENNEAREKVEKGKRGTDVMCQDNVEEDNNVEESCERTPKSQLQYELPSKSSSSIDSVKEDHSSISEGLKAEDVTNSFKDQDNISEGPAENLNNTFEEDHDSISEGPTADDLNNFRVEDRDNISEGPEAEDKIDSFEEDHDSINEESKAKDSFKEDPDSISEVPTAEDITNSFDEDDEIVSEELKTENTANSFEEDHDSISKESNAEDINLKNHIPVHYIDTSISDLIKDSPIQSSLDANLKETNGRTLIIQIDFNRRLKLADN